ncbi:TfoX/Sxy family protein [Enemella sp. A6]|uniref:TfoX/Sxy family protein n=1 Tax=Enemella sp. A6 TaxID=3440152 RepID=UPI003EB6D4E6
MSEPQSDLIERLREALATRAVTEQKMFGAHCFMVDGKLAACANKDGGLLARVDSDRQEEILARPGASISEMGEGRSMGPSWIRVAPEAVATDEQLSIWMVDVLEFNQRLTR